MCSIQENTHLPYEIIVADNGSTDGTAEMLASGYPAVKYIRFDENLGYTYSNNRAMEAASGEYVALLNPDTILHEHAFDKMCAYLAAHEGAGIVGPKVLNPDGSLQAPCRRGDSRPWAVISYFTGLSKLFPDHAFFNGYLLTHLDENETYPVDGVSGSCMLIRRDVIDQVGYLDETFFAYQEDADYCLRARKKGWQVVYYPEAEITHYGGQGGSRVQPYRSIFVWHESYFIYYRKHFAHEYFFLFNWLYYGAMGLKLAFALLKNFVSAQAFGGSRKPG